MITTIIKTITAILILGGSFFACESRQMTQDQKLIAEAEEYITTQSYEIAQQKLLQVIQLYPRNVRAHVLLGDVYYFQSNLIMFRMQILNLVFKYGKKIKWATPQELDLATPTEELLKKGMQYYKDALVLLAEGSADETVEPSYIHYELGWAYLAQDDVESARKSFQDSIVNGHDRWDAKSAFVYINFLEKKRMPQTAIDAKAKE